LLCNKSDDMALIACKRSFNVSSSAPRFQCSTPMFSLGSVVPQESLGGKRDFPGNLKETRLRMKSVKQIQKITATMKLISSSRLKAAERKVKEVAGFYTAASKILNLEKKETEEKQKPENEVKSVVVVPVCTDRGLCGSVNSALLKRAKLLVAEYEGKGISCKYIPIGDKASPILARDSGDKVIISFGDVSKRPLTFDGIGLIAEKIFEQNPDQVVVMYNKFNNVISNTLTITDVPNYKFLYTDKRLAEYETEDDQRLFELQDLYEFQVGSLLINAYVSNQASELGSRMSSMESATKNASEMLKRLTLKYNRGRQANITTELIEIISGATALEG